MNEEAIDTSEILSKQAKLINGIPTILELKIIKPGFLPRFFLILFLASCFLIPLAITAYAFIDGNFHIGIFIAWAFFGIIGLLLTRSLLWNLYGKEFIEIDKDKICYHADFKKFKTKKRCITGDYELVVDDMMDGKTKYGRLRFNGNDQTIASVIKLPYDDAVKIKAKIDQLV